MGQRLSTYRTARNENWDVLEEYPASINKDLMFQGFEWHVPADHQHWNRLSESLPRLKSLGVSGIWIPPGCKAATGGNGYDIYDLYDVGEFDQKDQIATKWGSKADLQHFILRANEIGIGIYWDAVLNHRTGADFKERCMAVQVNPNDRTINIAPPGEIEAWLGYNFSGRGAQYSNMKYRWYHFSGINYDMIQQQTGIYKLIGSGGKDWAQDVSTENGNYDYLMFSDVDYSNSEVRDDVKRWAEWLGAQFQLKGMRLDAVKHYSRAFLKEFIRHIRTTVGPDWFFVAEYWSGDLNVLIDYLDKMERLVSLFDVPLIQRFSLCSKENYDLRKIFDGTLVQLRPQNAVTFVANHDTQPGQSLETHVAAWFKPLAYALIMLRQDGHPCLFYGDLYGITNTEPKYRLPAVENLERLALVRKLYAHGKQRDYFDDKSCIGFVRYGDKEHISGLVCLLNSSVTLKSKTMYVGVVHAGETWLEAFSSSTATADPVKVDQRGYARFSVSPKSVSVWINEKASGREQILAMSA